MTASGGGATRGLVAAGGVVWRLRNHVLEVLLVHRPRYRDWSWPKGKTEPGEPVPVTAVREIAEETGEQVVLSFPLPTLSYRVNNGHKRVYYWAAQVAGPHADTIVRARPPIEPATRAEIDDVAWLPASDALAALTRAADRAPLLALLDAHGQGTLLTGRSIVVVRHARAVKRSAWHGGDEGSRPLTATGTVQADRLTHLLSCWAPTMVLTSGWERCVATIDPYVVATEVDSTVVPALTEHGARRHPKRVRRLVDALLRRPDEFDQSAHSIGPGPNVLVCTHRPVLPIIMTAFAEAAPAAVAKRVPHSEPYLHPAEACVLTVAQDGERQPVIRAVQRLR